MSQETRDISLDGEIHDSADPDVLDEPMGETEPEPEMMPTEEAPMEEPPMDMMDPQPTGLENEFKTVPGVQDPAPPMPSSPEAPEAPEAPQVPQAPMGDADDDVLFGDAPEQRTKNPRYY